MKEGSEAPRQQGRGFKGKLGAQGAAVLEAPLLLPEASSRAALDTGLRRVDGGLQQGSVGTHTVSLKRRESRKELRGRPCG